MILQARRTDAASAKKTKHYDFGQAWHMAVLSWASILLRLHTDIARVFVGQLPCRIYRHKA